MEEKFSALEIEIAEDMLTELLVHAWSEEGDRAAAWHALVDGVAEMLDVDAINRSREYATYRMRSVDPEWRPPGWINPAP